MSRFRAIATEGPPTAVAVLVLITCCAWLGISQSVDRACPTISLEQAASLHWRVDLNTAPEHELTLLARIGPTLAARIVADRTQNGPFETVAALARVRGIGPRTIIGIMPDAIASPQPARPIL